MKNFLSKIWGATPIGASCSPLNRFSFKVKSNTEKEHFCSKCGEITLHKSISEDELECTKCGKIVEDD